MTDFKSNYFSRDICLTEFEFYKIVLAALIVISVCFVGSTLKIYLATVCAASFLVGSGYFGGDSFVIFD